MDPIESQPSRASIPHSKPPQAPTSTHLNLNTTAATSSPTPITIRAPNSSRTATPYQKADQQARSSSAVSQTPSEHREYKNLKDSSRSEEMSEYVHQGIDPTVPIYEITHALPDALILKCADCQRFARVQPHLPGMELLPGPGDRGVHFKCSRCGGGQQMFRHSEKTWLEITLTSLYNLELQDKHKEGRRFFHVRQEICSFADRNWDIICLGRTRTPTWWATLNAQITTRTDLFETSKHGSGNWALRHSNISHPLPSPSELSSLDPSKEIPPEKPATVKLNATAIVSKKFIGERRFYLVTLEGNNGTVWRESTHPCFKSGELIRKFTKVETPTGKDGATSSSSNSSGSNGSVSPNSSSTPNSKSKPLGTRIKQASATRGTATTPLSPNSAALYTNQYSTATPLGVTLGVFTEKVVKAPTRLSRRQQSKQDAALAKRAAATPTSGSASPSSSNSSSSSKQSPMADNYRKAAKIIAGPIDVSALGARSNGAAMVHSSATMQHHQLLQQQSQLKNGMGMLTGTGVVASATNSAMAQHHQMMMGKLPANGTHPQFQQHPQQAAYGAKQLGLNQYQQLKLAQSPQPMRCHQCNRRQLSRPKPGQEFVFCTHTMSKVQGEMTLNVACTQSYCRTCIDLIYHEHPLEDEHETATWICPACRKICTCATCNDYVDPSGQAPPPSMVVTSSTPTIQLQQQKHLMQQQAQQQQYQMHYQVGSKTSTVSSSTSSSSMHHAVIHYDGLESPNAEESSSTTTAYTSSKSTPTGSVSLSPNVSTTWSGSAAGMGAGNSGSGMGGKSIPYPGALSRSNGSIDKSSGPVQMKNVAMIAAKIDRKSKTRLLVRMADSGACKWITDKPIPSLPIPAVAVATDPLPPVQDASTVPTTSSEASTSTVLVLAPSSALEDDSSSTSSASSVTTVPVSTTNTTPGTSVSADSPTTEPSKMDLTDASASTSTISTTTTTPATTPPTHSGKSLPSPPVSPAVIISSERALLYAQSKLEAQVHVAFESAMKIIIPAYDPTAQPPPKRSHAAATQQQNPQHIPQQSPAVPASPHNTRSNSGTRSSSQHPLSLYTQTLVSRTPSGRRRNNSVANGNSRQSSHSPANGQTANTGKHPQHSQTMAMQTPLYVSTNMQGSALYNGNMAASGGEMNASRGRRTTDLALAMPPHLNSYGSLNSPDGYNQPPERMFNVSKGKRPYTELSASTGDLGRQARRSSLLDSSLHEGGGTASKRRFIGSMDDMGDFMSASHDITSPRLSHESTFGDEEDAMVGGKTYHPHSHHHHGSHVLDDSVVAKEVEPIVAAPAIGMGEEEGHVMIVMPSQVVAPATSNIINPAEIMNGGGGFESWTDGAHHSMVEASWPDAPITSAFESNSSYF